MVVAFVLAAGSGAGRGGSTLGGFIAGLIAIAICSGVIAYRLRTWGTLRDPSPRTWSRQPTTFVPIVGLGLGILMVLDAVRRWTN